MTVSSPFTDVMSAVEEIRAGRMVVVVDDEDRENEGDLTMAAEKITPDSEHFLIWERAYAQYRRMYPAMKSILN